MVLVVTVFVTVVVVVVVVLPGRALEVAMVVAVWLFSGTTCPSDERPRALVLVIVFVVMGGGVELMPRTCIDGSSSSCARAHAVHTPRKLADAFFSQPADSITAATRKAGTSVHDQWDTL
eukprot:687284-Pyramimonas_sp.AAC.1